MTTVTKSLKILLVEDEPIPMLVHRKMLANLGYAPDTANNGQQALDMANNSYDVIFLDIGLPDIDGIAVATEIRRRQNNTPIIALTAYAVEEIHRECLMAGINKVITKPLVINTLQQLLLSHVNSN